MSVRNFVSFYQDFVGFGGKNVRVEGREDKARAESQVLGLEPFLGSHFFLRKLI
jgi:hypothetical protein